MTRFRLSDEDFLYIYGKVPRLCVDLIIRSKDDVLLAQRAIEPKKGMWNLPGGTVYKGEKIEHAALRVAKDETNLDCKFVTCHGYIEFLDEARSNIAMHSVSIAIGLEVLGGEMRHDKDANCLKYFNFKSLPKNIVPQQGEFLSTQYRMS